MLTEEQIKEIKSQLIKQITSTFPEDKKAEAVHQVEIMDEQQLENFLKQNNLIKEKEPSANEPSTVFRGIVSGQIPSHKIDENKYAVATLEINPISKGHTILIPKKEANSIEKIPQPVFTLAKKISKKIKSKLKPKEVKIASSNSFGESIINIFPVYENESLTSQRYHAEEKELQEIQKKLGKKERKKIIKIKKKKQEESEKETLRLPKRIP